MCPVVADLAPFVQLLLDSTLNYSPFILLVYSFSFSFSFRFLFSFLFIFLLGYSMHIYPSGVINLMDLPPSWPLLYTFSYVSHTVSHSDYCPLLYNISLVSRSVSRSVQFSSFSFILSFIFLIVHCCTLFL